MSKNTKGKLLVICGPTATGKTGLGIKIAKKFGGEIVSADSRQVYRGMDIGTGKDLPQRAKLKAKSEKLKVKAQGEVLKPYRFDGIPVWLLDIVEPNCQFSVADYVKCANLVIEDIWKRGKSRPKVEDPRRKASGLPILVGGTGFYIKALIDGVKSIGVPPGLELREELQSYPVSELQSVLERTCPERMRRMNKSDRQNPRRLVRAIEVAKKAKNSKRKVQSYNLKVRTKDILMIGLTALNKILYERIDKRVDKRVKHGIEKEIGGLMEKGYNWENSVMGLTLGYREWKEHFRGAKVQRCKGTKLKRKLIQKWKYNEHGYARRQMTWFRKDKRIHWFDISQKGWENEVEKLFKNWYIDN